MVWDNEAKRQIARYARARWDDAGLPEPAFSGPEWTIERHVFWCKLIAQAADEMGYSSPWK